MTAFGGVFRSPALEGVEEGEDSGQRARLVGLDLESGVVRVQASRPAVAQPTEAARDEPEQDEPERDEPED